MNSIKITFALALLTTFSFLQSCKEKVEDDPIPVATFGTAEIEFEHVWGMNQDPFAMNTTLVHPMTKDTLKFSTLKYYVSNIQLKKSDGTWWKDEDSYYLVDLSVNQGNMLKLKNIPSGTYTAIKYVLGVDSLRNVSGAQTGALSVSNAMFWSWNSGYIMIKAEGTSQQANGGDFAFHLGGFMGANNCIVAKESDLNGATIEVKPDANPIIHFLANPAKLWHSSPSLSVTSKIHMPGPYAKTMATDFFGGTVFDHVHQ